MAAKMVGHLAGMLVAWKAEMMDVPMVVRLVEYWVVMTVDCLAESWADVWVGMWVGLKDDSKADLTAAQRVVLMVDLLVAV